ncbi:phosphoribosyltransferase [Streptomyces sp. CC210A]|uniref:phosphoribosyltransferase n=1 Tax=Streptomyces sp. CC210A TaxID=2898184 RepID=UPI001F3704B1|nr:phosphoribosyltransferase [Streptomyces sp. CC210A]
MREHENSEHEKRRHVIQSTAWTGTWVAERLGVELRGEDTGRLTQLLGLALRDNPKRAHLLVSRVLGKHVPQSPAVVRRSGYGLGRRVRDLLGDADARRAVVLGYAETATGLGHCVADGLALAPYLHSTRRPVPGVARAAGFEESHSHHTSHLLLPSDPGLLSRPGPLVLVDDEFSTGSTVLNTIRALHERHPRERYVIVALVDMRSPADRRRLEEFAGTIGARVDLVALAAGTVRLPDGVLEKGRALVAAHRTPPPALAGDPATVRTVDLGWPAGLPDGGRHGFTPEHRAALGAALPGMAARLAEALVPRGGAAPRRVLVLGCEEFMYVPLALAGALEDRAPHVDVRFSTTTRSPVLAVDDPGYAIRTRLVFPAHDDPADGPGDRYAYNVAGGGFDAVAVVVDSTADTPALREPGSGLLAQLVAHVPHVVLATVPSYVPANGSVSSSGLEDGSVSSSGLANGSAPGAPLLAPDPVTPPTAPPAGPEAPLVDRHLKSDGPQAPLAGPHLKSAGSGPAIAAAVPPTPASGQPPAAPPAPIPPYGPAAAAEAAHERSTSMLPEPLRGPAFSSYAPDEVGWLLQDLSGVELEAPTEEREEAVQRGGAHYAESLPIEYQPSDRYQKLFHAALDTSAVRIARAVGAVTETVLAERSPRPVLVSLARAGTPVGVLMRRWAQARHGLDLPHYAVSIVRGRGIDANALRWLRAHHDPADVVFVDGWTGKGAITRELAAALAGFPGFDPEIAVLADPGSCVRTYGTREDFLIPSACLNSTVSGLVSRTVLRADLVGPDDYHGAKYYRELAGADVSGDFLDAVSDRFAEVAEAVAQDAARLLAADRTPTWAGWKAVERISEEYGIHDVNLVKPGVGETTRVLLRRVPWKVLARRGAGPDLDHVRLLAEQRGVPVEEVDGLPYTCVGLIHPQYTRGATGSDGKAVTAP